MNGIDLLDVPDIAELPYEHLATILDDPMVKAKLSAMQKEVEEKRKAAELDEEKIRNGTKTPAEVAELRLVKKQKERLEQLNQKIEIEKAELQAQLQEAQKQSQALSKDFNHARREAAHFANEATLAKARLAQKAEESTVSQTVPEQLAMDKTATAVPAHTGGMGGTHATHTIFEDRDDDIFDGSPEEVSKKLQQRIAFQKRTLARLEQELTKFKNGDPSAGKQRLPSSWAYRGDDEAMKALRQQKILDAKEKRDQRLHGGTFGRQDSIVAVLGVEADTPKKTGPTWRAGPGAKKKPSWL